MSRTLQFLARNWMWWVPPLLVVAILALTLLWLHRGDTSSPFEYDLR